MQVRQIDLQIEDLDSNGPLSVKLAAAVYADKQNFEISSKVGRLARSHFNEIPLRGALNIDPLNLSRLQEALPTLKSALPKDLYLSGVFRVNNLSFRGSLKDLSVNGEIEGTSGAWRYGKTFQKPAGTAFTMSADARYSGEKLSINKGRLKLHTLELASAGDIHFGDNPIINLSFNSQPASLEGWDKLIPALSSYQMTGTIDVRANFRGKIGRGATPHIEGNSGAQKGERPAC